MRTYQKRKPLDKPDSDREQSGEEEHYENEIVDDDDEEDSDDESIDIPPDPEHEANMERLRAQNIMLRSVVAQQELVRKEMEERRQMLEEAINERKDEIANSKQDERQNDKEPSDNDDGKE